MSAYGPFGADPRYGTAVAPLSGPNRWVCNRPKCNTIFLLADEHQIRFHVETHDLTAREKEKALWLPTDQNGKKYFDPPQGPGPERTYVWDSKHGNESTDAENVKKWVCGYCARYYDVKTGCINAQTHLRREHGVLTTAMQGKVGE